jgi:hypothetical protein
LKKAKPTKKKAVLKGKYTADIQNKLDEIRTLLKADREQARNKIVANIAAYHAGTMSYEDMRSANDRLSMVGAKGMTSEELQHVLDTVKSLKAGGKEIRQAKRESEIEAIEPGKIMAGITGGRGLKTGTGTVPKESLEAKKGTLESLINWNLALDNYLDKLSKFEKSEPYKGKLSKLGDRVHQAESDEAAGIEKLIQQINTGLAEAFGAKNAREGMKALNNLKEETDLGAFTNADGETVNLKLNREQIIKKYMEMQDPTLEATFKGGIDENGKKWGMRWTDTMIDAVANSLTEQERAWADFHLDFYRGYYDSVNEVYRQMYGVDLPKNTNYSPIGRDVESEIPEDLLLAQEGMRYASTINGSLKTRVRNAVPLRFTEADKVLMNHIIRMEHFKAWTPVIRDMRRVFGNKDIRRAIRQYHGSNILKHIDLIINQMASGGIDQMLIHNWLDKMRSNFTKAVLFPKPAIALKQVPSVLAYETEMPFTDYVSGIAKFWMHPLQNYQMLKDASPVLRERWKAGYERDIKLAMKKGYAKRLAGRGSFMDWLSALVRAGDKLATMQGSYAKYLSAQKKGDTKQKAILEAEMATGRTQPTSKLSTLAKGQRSGSLWKLLTMFQNQPNKYFRIVTDNMRNFRYGRGSRTKALGNILVAWALLPMLFQWIADAFRIRPKKQAQAALLGPLATPLILGQVIKQIVAWAMGETFDYQASPVESNLRKIKAAIAKTRKIAKATIDPGKDIKIDDVVAAIEYYAEFIGPLAGIPTPYAVQAEKAIRKGEPEQLIFTPYALGEKDKKPKAANYKSR